MVECSECRCEVYVITVHLLANMIRTVRPMFCCYLHVLPIALSNNRSFSNIKKHIPVQSCKWSHQLSNVHVMSVQLSSSLKIFSIHTQSQRPLLSCNDQHTENHKMFVQFDRMSYLSVNLRYDNPKNKPPGTYYTLQNLQIVTHSIPFLQLN